MMGALGTGFRGGSPLLLFLRLSEAAALFSPDSKPLSCGDGFRTPTRGGMSTGNGGGTVSYTHLTLPTIYSV